MKKIVAMMLALMLVLVSVSALAANPTAVGERSITFPKEYTVTYVGSNVKLPADAITFSAELTNITTPDVTVTDALKTQYAATIAYTDPAETNVTKNSGEAQGTGNLTVTLPPYDQVGVYTYKITETSTKNPAGVGYQGDVYMKVIVILVPEEPATETTPAVPAHLDIGSVSFRTAADPENKLNDETEKPTKKLTAITNTYDAGDLTIDKQVKGNMGEQDRLFEITVTFNSTKKVYGTVTISKTGTAELVSIGGTAATSTTNSIAAETDGWTSKAVVFKLAHSDTIKFENLPDGVTYTVAETDTTFKADEYKDAVITGETGTISKSSENTATVTNEKNIDVDTGIALDAVPYMMIMAIALMGAAMMIVRRREEM